MFMLLVLSLFASKGGAARPAVTAPLRPASVCRITGRAVAAAAKPISHARITAGGRLLGRSGADGRFAVVVAAPAPESIAIGAAAYAARTIPLPRGLNTVALGDVRLLRGGAIAVDLSKTPGVRELSLVRYDQRNDERHATTRRIAASTHSARFDGLEPGDYLLTARGSGPLQRKARVVNVSEVSTARVQLTIDPMPLRGYVFLGRQPLAGAEVQIDGPGSVWRGTLHTDAEGHYAAELWQVGPLQALVSSPKLATEYATGHRATEALERGAVEWDIVVPDREVVGRVVDAATGAPVPNAAVSLEAADEEIHARINVRTDDKGEFRYGGARTGRFTLDVDAPQYLRPAMIQFALSEGDPSKNIEVKLDRGAEVMLHVRRDDGTPLPNAVVAESLTGEDARSLERYRASAAGEVTLRVRPGEEKTLYAIPPEGSFAVAHVLFDAKTIEHGVDLTVPAARSVLVIRARDQEGAPLDGVRFMVRYNGEIIPPPILALLRNVQHSDYRTTPAGEARLNGLPNGFYELWAYRTAEEATRLVENAGGYPPAAAVAVSDGTYEAELTFQP
jgi:hypothetical protein